MTEIEIINLINLSLSEEFELDLNEMKPQAHIFEDLGLDSLDIVDMVIILEKAFSFKIHEEKEVREIRTLGQIHTFVISKKNEINKGE